MLLFCEVEALTLSTSSRLIIHLPHPHCKRVNQIWVDKAGLPLTMFNVVGSGLTDQTGGIPNAGQPNFPPTPPRPAPPRPTPPHPKRLLPIILFTKKKGTPYFWRKGREDQQPTTNPEVGVDHPNLGILSTTMTSSNPGGRSASRAACFVAVFRTSPL